jgi:hypothetical protein
MPRCDSAGPATKRASTTMRNMVLICPPRTGSAGYNVASSALSRLLLIASGARKADAVVPYDAVISGERSRWERHDYCKSIRRAADGWRSGLADAGRMASSGAARMRSSSNGWTAHPNLQRRPHAPAAGRGRLQVQIRLAFVGHRLLSSSQVYDSAPNNRRSLYRIAHLAFVTVYLVGRIAPLVGKLGVHAYHARIARCPCFLLAFQRLRTHLIGCHKAFTEAGIQQFSV